MDRELSPSSSAPPAEEAQKKELVEEFKDITVVLPAAIAVGPHLHDVVSQVFFKKLTDNEFVDMKVESPRGATLTHLEPEGKEAEEEEEEDAAKAEDDRKGDGCESMNTWNRRLVGVGTFCSLGAAAAATAFMFVLGGRHRQSQQHNHRIQFCIYSDDKVRRYSVQPQVVEAPGAAREGGEEETDRQREEEIERQQWRRCGGGRGC
ncbi:hypothetical protein ZIOFF_027041 [Zingiber officinale]|uniref:DUF6821 domain-containing protein n=1 Tax=Zingiber officinale TaxID=94328 RepID=A0A8J5H5R4_ZINOF|nr:hypothetical protein ZIOFF_027041 [Zingiber officinale]